MKRGTRVRKSAEAHRLLGRLRLCSNNPERCLGNSGLPDETSWRQLLADGRLGEQVKRHKSPVGVNCDMRPRYKRLVIGGPL